MASLPIPSQAPPSAASSLPWYVVYEERYVPGVPTVYKTSARTAAQARDELQSFHGPLLCILGVYQAPSRAAAMTLYRRDADLPIAN